MTNTESTKRIHRLWFALLAVLALVASACASGDGSPGAEAVAQDDAGETAAGGQDGDDGAAGGGDYPSKPIRVIITFDPGGGSDTDFRRLQPHLEEILGVKLEPDYVTGAGGAIGWAELAHAEPDGYTIGTVVLPHILLQPELIGDTGYETFDFDFVAMNAYAPQMLFVSAENPAFESFEEFAEAAESGEPINIGGSAEFNLSHAVQAQLAAEGLSSNWVATGEGSTSVVSGVLGGHFPVGITSIQQLTGREDELLPLAVSSDGPYELYPDIPTFSSFGHDITGATNWGVAGPKGMDPEHIEVLGDAIAQAMEREDVQANIEAEGQGAIGLGPDEARAHVEDYMARMQGVIETFQSS